MSPRRARQLATLIEAFRRKWMTTNQIRLWLSHETIIQMQRNGIMKDVEVFFFWGPLDAKGVVRGLNQDNQKCWSRNVEISKASKCCENSQRKSIKSTTTKTLQCNTRRAYTYTSIQQNTTRSFQGQYNVIV